MNEYTKHLTHNLITLRRQQHLTQIQFAQILNIDRSTFQNYEKGIRIIPSDVLLHIADYYKVSLDSLYNRNIKN